MKALIITIKINSPIKTADQELPSFKEESSLVSLAILQEKLNFLSALVQSLQARDTKS